MKILLALFLMSTCMSAAAQHRHHHHHHYHAHSNQWLAPAIIGGIVGYALAQPRPQIQYYNVPPVVQYYYAPPQPVCNTWVYQNAWGQMVRETVCY